MDWHSTVGARSAIASRAPFVANRRAPPEPPVPGVFPWEPETFWRRTLPLLFVLDLVLVLVLVSAAAGARTAAAAGARAAAAAGVRTAAAVGFRAAGTLWDIPRHLLSHPPRWPPPGSQPRRRWPPPPDSSVECCPRIDGRGANGFLLQEVTTKNIGLALRIR